MKVKNVSLSPRIKRQTENSIKPLKTYFCSKLNNICFLRFSKKEEILPGILSKEYRESEIFPAEKIPLHIYNNDIFLCLKATILKLPLQKNKHQPALTAITANGGPVTNCCTGYWTYHIYLLLL